MLTFTLDTGCVIAAVNNEPEAGDVEHLVGLARAGEIRLARTTGFEADQTTAAPKNQRQNLNWLRSVPILSAAGVLRFSSGDVDEQGNPISKRDRVNYPFFNSGGFGGPGTTQWEKQIKAILLPGVLSTENAGRRMIDVHHLLAHQMAGHDYFVTLNSNDMITGGRRERLRSGVRIKVITPAEAVHIAAQSHPAP